MWKLFQRGGSKSKDSDQAIGASPEPNENQGKEKRPMTSRSFLSGGQVRTPATVTPEAATQAASRLETLRQRQETLSTRETAVAQKEEEVNTAIAADTEALNERESAIASRETAVTTDQYRKDDIDSLESRERALGQRESSVGEREEKVQQEIAETERQIAAGEEDVERREEAAAALEAQFPAAEQGSEEGSSGAS